MSPSLLLYLPVGPAFFHIFKGRGVALDVQAESAPHDLALGEKVTCVISIRGMDLNQPRLYQLNFGIDQNRPVTAEAVL